MRMHRVHTLLAVAMLVCSFVLNQCLVCATMSFRMLAPGGACYDV